MILARADWTARAAAHAARADAAASGHLARRSRGEKHPVADFLWEYYALRPGVLRRWHPGAGVTLAEAPERAAWRFHRATAAGVELDPDAYLAARGSAVRFVAGLLAATASRPGQWACFGLHEWAMVYRTDVTRHAVPLRLGPAGTDAVVEAAHLRCTHHDAFRFFTPAAVPLNATAPTREGQADAEQPGCLHATMDCLKWCLKLGPAVPGELLLDAFDLARAARELDMRVAPYDLAEWGYAPIPIETPAGRATFVRHQRRIAERGATLRRRLLAVCALLDPHDAEPAGRAMETR